MSKQEGLGKMELQHLSSFRADRSKYCTAAENPTASQKRFSAWTLAACPAFLLLSRSVRQRKLPLRKQQLLTCSTFVMFSEMVLELFVIRHLYGWVVALENNCWCSLGMGLLSCVTWHRQKEWVTQPSESESIMKNWGCRSIFCVISTQKSHFVAAALCYYLSHFYLESCGITTIPDIDSSFLLVQKDHLLPYRLIITRNWSELTGQLFSNRLCKWM